MSVEAKEAKCQAKDCGKKFKWLAMAGPASGAPRFCSLGCRKRAFRTRGRKVTARG